MHQSAKRAACLVKETQSRTLKTFHESGTTERRLLRILEPCKPTPAVCEFTSVDRALLTHRSVKRVDFCFVRLALAHLHYPISERDYITGA